LFRNRFEVACRKMFCRSFGGGIRHKLPIASKNGLSKGQRASGFSLDFQGARLMQQAAAQKQGRPDLPDGDRLDVPDWIRVTADPDIATGLDLQRCQSRAER
jgi:hypothetical protein